MLCTTFKLRQLLCIRTKGVPDSLIRDPFSVLHGPYEREKITDSSGVRVGKGFGDPPCEFPYLADKKTEAQRGYTMYRRTHSFSRELTSLLFP